MGYSVSDPSKTFKLEMSGIAGIFWTSVANNAGQDPINVLDMYSFDQFTAHKENACVKIGDQNFISVFDPTHYQAVGQSKDGMMSWSLNFVHAKRSCRRLD